MAYSRLALDTDKYEIFISNEDIEYTRTPDTGSSASDFQTILDPALDISSLIYLKSSNAELSLDQIYIDGLPLCFTQTEDVSIYIAVPPHSTQCNQTVNETAVGTFNDQPYAIAFEDVAKDNVHDIVNYLNDLICEPLTHFLLKSCLRCVLDVDVLKPIIPTSFNLDEIKLLIRYVECALFSRHIIHRHLTGVLKTDDNIDNWILFKQTKGEQESMSLEWESSIINESQCIIGPAARIDAGPGRFINLNKFRGISLRHAYNTSEESPMSSIEGAVKEYLDNVFPDLKDEAGNVASDIKPYIYLIIEANKDMIKLATKCRQILLHNRDRINKKHRDPELFHDYLVKFKVDNDNCKLVVETNPDLFLTNTSVLVLFPDQASYILGSKSGENATIGPIRRGSHSETDLPALTNVLKAPNQRLFSGIRPSPHIIHVLLDSVGSLAKDLWLRNSEHNDYSIVHTIILDSVMQSARFISKVNDSQVFYRTSNSRKILNGIKVRLVDSNFRILKFPVCTIVKVSFTLRPVLHENL